MNAEPQVQLNSTERSEWTVFILSLFHRTPDNLQATITSAMKMFDETLDSARGIYPNLRGDNDPITFEDYRDGLTLAERRRSALNSLPSVMTNQAIGQFMHDMHTQVFTLPAGPRDFLLSDDPIARTNGWKTDDGHFAIPISPRKLFVSAWKLETLNRFARMKPEEIVAAMNTVSVEGARFFVAAKDQSQDRFIRNRFGRNLRSSIYSQPDIPLPLTKITI